MSQTIEAVINQEGQVQLLESIRLNEARRALVTILDEAPTEDAALDLGYQQMAQDEERLRQQRAQEQQKKQQEEQ